MDNPKIYVEKNAIKKLETIAELMEDYEFKVKSLTTNRFMIDNIPVIEDFYIDEDQTATGSEIKVEPAKREIIQKLYDQGYRVIGSSHGHGGYGVFYSGVDIKQFRIDIGAMGFVIEHYKDLKLTIKQSGDKYYVEGDNGSKVRFEVENKQKAEEIIQTLKSSSTLEKYVKVVSGIVINRKKELFGIQRFRESYINKTPESAKKEKGTDFDIKNDRIYYNLESKIVQTEFNEPIEINREELLKELKEKITIKRRPPSSFVKAELKQKNQEIKLVRNILKGYFESENKYVNRLANALKNREYSSLEESIINSDNKDTIMNNTKLNVALHKYKDDKFVEEIYKLKESDNINDHIDQIIEDLIPQASEENIQKNTEIEKIDTQKSKIIQCNPDIQTEAVYNLYFMQAGSTNYRQIYSAKVNVESILEEYRTTNTQTTGFSSCIELVLDRYDKQLKKLENIFEIQTEKQYELLIGRLSYAKNDERKKIISGLTKVSQSYQMLGNKKYIDINDQIEILIENMDKENDTDEFNPVGDYMGQGRAINIRV